MADVTLSSILGGGSGGLASATLLRAYAYSANTMPPGSTQEDPGALTASVWKTVLTLTSPGIFHWAGVRHGSGTSRSVGLRVTIDGTVVASVDNTAGGFINGGVSIGSAITNTSAPPVPVFAPFQTLLVEIRSSDSTSDVRYGVTYVSF